MIKKFALIFIGLAMFIMANQGACEDKRQPVIVTDDTLTWSFYESPETGNCYEIASFSHWASDTGYGYMAMHQIDNKFCEER